MSRRRYLLQVWREGRDEGRTFVKSDSTTDMAVALTFACSFLVLEEEVPGQVRAAAQTLIDVVRGPQPMPPVIDVHKPGGTT